ncbi:MAG: UMP kinase [Candidatus Magasanikbacteria bacterium CG10_big_fil_rev_8_21_14_0_10_43_6]|uniref:UMP kinase n=1 Tax=Candidatus Magasanikbacteria bacterium CG10_big_fil_rev_8_21_14_0_10_43_6 TaxID=1974650 RepID=A0A2M6W0A7_9BACT|nr:MAG: UMP kinase [Candidatus Magasanikbacteria bacterium CG10_big_fil_rev_8_21_14_0_10_43_6]
MSNTHKILSVGGSIIIPKTGFDIFFLKKFRSLILERVKKGDKFILVVGGGATCRVYQDAARKVTSMGKDDLDWIGIHSTVFNAQFVRMLFKDYAHHEVIQDPRKKITTKKPIIIAAGWKPGCSTDNDAVLLAKTFGVKELLNLSNIEYVYDKDPNIYKNAKPIAEIDWKTLRKQIVGNTWDPGKSAPFDPIASKTAQKLGLHVSILKGTDLKELKKALEGKDFIGTKIRP